VLETCRELKSKINKYIEEVVRQVGYLPEIFTKLCLMHAAGRWQGTHMRCSRWRRPTKCDRAVATSRFQRPDSRLRHEGPA
jgi:hypothetical protein